MVQLNEKIDAKGGYMIDLLEGHARINDPARRLPFEAQEGQSGAGSSEVDEEVNGGVSTPVRPNRSRGKQPRRP